MRHLGRTQQSVSGKEHTHTLYYTSLSIHRHDIMYTNANVLVVCPLHLTLQNQTKMAAKCASSQWPCAHELLPKDEAWKHRPPYTVPREFEFGPVKWRGRCHCGQVTYSLNREKPLNAKYCHCRGCQLMHGRDLLLQYLCLRLDSR